jgi:glycosyltransferase involved in cell wall biosynthesis
MAFYAFSRPRTSEDRTLGRAFWAQPHIHRLSIPGALARRFDIVHYRSVTWRALALVALSRARSGGHSVRIFTAASIPPKIPGYQQYRLGVQSADLLVAVSQAVADTIATQFSRPVDAVIPNGVDQEFFSHAAADPAGWQMPGVRRPYALFVGVLTRDKRPDVVLELAARMPHLTFVLVGGTFSASERADFLRCAAGYSNVVYLGLQPRARVRDLMAAAAVLVFPSAREGMPLTVLEAAAMGLPVLAQPASALPEVVHPDVTGWLLPVDAPDAWVEKIEHIIGWSAAERTEFAQRARAYAAQHHSWDTIALRYRALYLQAQERFR